MRISSEDHSQPHILASEVLLSGRVGRAPSLGELDAITPNEIVPDLFRAEASGIITRLESSGEDDAVKLVLDAVRDDPARSDA